MEEEVPKHPRRVHFYRVYILLLVTFIVTIFAETLSSTIHIGHFREFFLVGTGPNNETLRMGRKLLRMDDREDDYSVSCNKLACPFFNGNIPLTSVDLWPVLVVIIQWFAYFFVFIFYSIPLSTTSFDESRFFLYWGMFLSVVTMFAQRVLGSLTPSSQTILIHEMEVIAWIAMGHNAQGHTAPFMVYDVRYNTELLEHDLQLRIPIMLLSVMIGWGFIGLCYVEEWANKFTTTVVEPGKV